MTAGETALNPPAREMEMQELNEREALLVLRLRVTNAGSQKMFAKSAGLSEQYISDVLNGKRSMGSKLLVAIGLERVVIYRRIKRRK